MVKTNWISGLPADVGTRVKVDFKASLRIRPCPLCGADEYRVFHQEYAATDFWYTDDVFLVARCKQCLFVYSPIIPSPEWLSRYKDPSWNPELRAQGKVSVDTYEHAEWLSLQAYEIALKYLSKAHPRLRSILDAGCSEGRFLVLARDRGYKVTGIEPHPLAVQRAQHEFGLDVKCSTLQSLRLQGSFNIVTLWDVIEHLDDPLVSLKHINALLTENGVLVIKTPNFYQLIKTQSNVEENTVQPRIYPYWGSTSWHAWDHINFFTADTLGHMLRIAGFTKPVKFLIDKRPGVHAGRIIQVKAAVRLMVARWLVYLFGGKYHRWLTLFAVVQK